MGFAVNPIKIYLPKNIIDESLTIQFINGKEEKIEFDKKMNTINYKIITEVITQKTEAKAI